MLKTLMGVVLLIFGISVPVISSGKEMPAGRWWRMPRLVEQLKISEGEKKSLDALFMDSRRKLIDLRSAVEREQFELEMFLEKEKFDEKAAMAQFGRLDTARSNIAREQFGYLIKVRNILGPERFQRLKNRFKEFRGKIKSRSKPRFKNKGGFGSSSN